MESQKNKDKKVVRPLSSIHVVHYTCGNCSEEEEHAKLCSACKAPMRVIQVVELYGEEANEYLDNLKKKSGKEEKPISVNSVQYDDSVLGVNDDEEDTEDIPLGDIFPDDDESTGSYVGDDISDDFESALDILDQEDEDDDIEDLPEL